MRWRLQFEPLAFWWNYFDQDEAEQIKARVNEYILHLPAGSLSGGWRENPVTWRDVEAQLCVTA